jgi:hypothetical protein
MVSISPTPRACGWRSLARIQNRPLTSHVIATARALRLRPKSSLATRTVLRRPECFTAATRSVCDPPGKGRTATTPGRLLPYRARCLATPLKPECGFDPANRASRVRSPRPLSPPLIAGVSDSSVARSSPERRSHMACGHASRRSHWVIDQRCVRSTSANDTSTTGTHVSFGDLPALSRLVLLRAPPSPADAWRVSRRPTHFGCVGPCCFSRRAFFFPLRRPSDHPLTLPSPRAAYPRASYACAYLAFACMRRPPLTGVRRRLRARGQDHPLTRTRDGSRKY